MDISNKEVLSGIIERMGLPELPYGLDKLDAVTTSRILLGYIALDDLPRYMSLEKRGRYTFQAFDAFQACLLEYVKENEGDKENALRELAEEFKEELKPNLDSMLSSEQLAGSVIKNNNLSLGGAIFGSYRTLKSLMGSDHETVLDAIIALTMIQRALKDNKVVYSYEGTDLRVKMMDMYELLLNPKYTQLDDLNHKFIASSNFFNEEN